MRIDFQESGTTQQPVTPAQSQMRQARSEKRPVLSFLILLVLIGAAAYAFYYFTRAGTIYTYGVVTAELTPYFAPFEGTISDLNLAQGQIVEEGEVLFVLAPAPPERVLAAQESLIQEIERLNEVAIQTQANLVEQARREVDRHQALYTEDSARRQGAIASADIEVRKLLEVYESLRQRADRVTELYEMGAAIQSDVEGATDAAQVARFNLDQARQGLSVAEEQGEASDAALEKAKLELARLTEGNVADTTALERGRVEIAAAQLVPEDLHVEALFDSVVLGVGAVEGSRVELGRVVAHLAARESIWIEAYVPVKHAEYVQPGTAVTVRLPGVDEPISGTIENESGSAIRLPELLRDDLPRMHTGIYARVKLDLPEGITIVPGGQVEVIIPTEG